MKSQRHFTSTTHHRGVRKQQGIALVVSLLILLVTTMIALSLFRGSNLLEKIAGNTREKQRSLQSAQDALIYGEWWLSQGGSNIAVQPCTAATTTTLQVCSTPLTTANYTGLPLYSYALPGITVSATSGLAAGGDINYVQNPVIYIAFLGTSPVGNPLYQVSAIGYGGSGGNNGSKSMVQSVYSITLTNPGDLGKS
jgi:type IV pilus assembly protein PilX